MSGWVEFVKKASVFRVVEEGEHHLVIKPKRRYKLFWFYIDNEGDGWTHVFLSVVDCVSYPTREYRLIMRLRNLTKLFLNVKDARVIYNLDECKTSMWMVPKYGYPVVIYLDHYPSLEVDEEEITYLVIKQV